MTTTFIWKLRWNGSCKKIQRNPTNYDNSWWNMFLQIPVLEYLKVLWTLSLDFICLKHLQHHTVVELIFLSGVAHPLENCRLYYSQMVLDCTPLCVCLRWLDCCTSVCVLESHNLLSYIDLNRNKKNVYRTYCSNMYLNIQKGSINQLIKSEIEHPTGVWIVPFIGSVTTTDFGDSKWKSSFDTCPATNSPCSLTNLQVSVGGSCGLQSALVYTHENFLEQVNLTEQLTSADFGVSTGLMSQGYWQCPRWYHLNVERSKLANKLRPRNIDMSWM